MNQSRAEFIKHQQTLTEMGPFAGGYIKTVSGYYINPVNPDPMAICLYDIAMALAKEPRFGGHTVSFRSVAAHSVHCAEVAKELGYSDEEVLACLLHDAAEAYIKDIPSPLKSQIVGYKEIENNLLAVIFTRYGIPG